MQTPSTTALRHMPVLPPQVNPGLPQPQTQTPPTPVAPGISPSTCADPGVPFAGHVVRCGPTDLQVASRKRKREEGEGSAPVSSPMAEEEQAGPGPSCVRRMAALVSIPVPVTGRLLMASPQVPSFARQGAAPSDADRRVADGDFRLAVGPAFTGSLQHKARQVSDLVQAVLSISTAAQAEVAGARLGRELKDEFASTGRRELLRAITRAYAQWHGAQSLRWSPQAQAAHAEEVLAAFLRGLAQSPARQGPDPQVSLVCEFLDCSQSWPAGPVRDGKAGPGDDKAGADTARRATSRQRAQAREQEAAFETFNDEHLVERLAAVACRVEGGSRITQQALEGILRMVLRVPDDGPDTGKHELRDQLDARDIGDLIAAIVGAIDDGRGSKRQHMPALIRGILSLDGEDGLTPDEVGLAIACVVDACARSEGDAQDALVLVLEQAGPGLSTRGAAALAVGAVFGLGTQDERIACETDPADLTYMLRSGLDVALQHVGRLAQGRGQVRTDRLVPSLLAYREVIDARLRALARRDESDAKRAKQPFDPAGTALHRFDAGLADLLASKLERAKLASQWAWLVRLGLCVGYGQASAEARQAFALRLLPATLRSAEPLAGESAARSQARLQQRADLQSLITRALDLAASPLAVVDEPGLDNENRIELMALCGYFHTATSEALGRKVAAVKASPASPTLRDLLLEKLQATTTAPFEPQVSPLPLVLQVEDRESPPPRVPASSSTTSSTSSLSFS